MIIEVGLPYAFQVQLIECQLLFGVGNALVQFANIVHVDLPIRRSAPRLHPTP